MRSIHAKTVRAATLLLAAGLGACAPSASLEAQELRPADLQAALDAWAAQPAHHGVSASVILADGTQWAGVAGHEDATSKIRPEHLFWLASITKTLTGAVTLQLALESRLSLDDSVRRWLPVGSRIDPRITIRQLLNRTSGVPLYGASVFTRANGSLMHVFTAEELLAAVGAPIFAPGTRTQYSNTAFVMLARIAEQVTGKPLVRLLRERLWAPLALKEMFMIGHEPPPGPVARAAGAEGVVQPLENLTRSTAGHGAGAVFASARDVARWGRALFTGSVLSPETQREMRALVPAAGNIPGESGSGLGVRGDNFLGRQQYGHSGGAIWGNSLLVHDPTSGVTVAVLTNQGAGADHFVLAPRLLEIVTGRSRAP
ncbi:MAG: beta-lactamase family protein [Gemmatimonadales bacterium]|nr:beta-lactamase family protein [Gemmatimonadales bacterium]